MLLPETHSVTSPPKTLSRFDIYWVNLDPTVGREIKKTRPCVIVSPDELNGSLGTVIVAPLTHTINNWPFRLTITHGSDKASIACDHIRSISKKRLVRPDGILDKTNQKKLLNILQATFA